MRRLHGRIGADGAEDRSGPTGGPRHRPPPGRLRLRVDPVACDAYGFCAELLPERITLDEWGYPIVDGTPVDPNWSAWPAGPPPSARDGRCSSKRSSPTRCATDRARRGGQSQTVPEGGSRLPRGRW